MSFWWVFPGSKNLLKPNSNFIRQNVYAIHVYDKICMLKIAFHRDCVITYFVQNIYKWLGIIHSPLNHIILDTHRLFVPLLCLGLVIISNSYSYFAKWCYVVEGNCTNHNTNLIRGRRKGYSNGFVLSWIFKN